MVVLHIMTLYLTFLFQWQNPYNILQNTLFSPSPRKH